MSFAFLLLAFLAAVNPPRAVAGLDVGRAASAIGAATALALAAVLAASADAVLDVLDVSPESFRIAAGLVGAAAGLRTVVAPLPSEDAAVRGYLTAVVPVLFPRLLTPELVVLVVATAADEQAVEALGSLAVALAAAVLLGPMRRSGALVAAAARLLGAALVVVGVALVVDGVRDV